MNANLLSQGLELLVYGMGTVVVFLTLLVFATRIMSAVILRFFPQAPIVVPQRARSSALDPLANNAATANNAETAAATPEVLAAITAAVHQHRRRRAVSPNSDSDQRKAHV
ncbi:OadG family protein [Congregibacter sp.]|uniref:OadG family protein n=1 Tax=Congregibacter sp. TaxID=2744308 RepID=UPI003F6D531D